MVLTNILGLEALADQNLMKNEKYGIDRLTLIPQNFYMIFLCVQKAPRYRYMFRMKVAKLNSLKEKVDRS